MPSVCIECGNEREGYPVKEDYVIAGIRKMKSMFGVAKNNTLVVCRDCVDMRKQRREKFEKRFVQHGALAVIVFLFLVLFPLFFGGSRDIIALIQTVLMAAVLGLVIIFLALVNYSPAFDTGSGMVGKEGDYGEGKPAAAMAEGASREEAAPKKIARKKAAQRKAAGRKGK